MEERYMQVCLLHCNTPNFFVFHSSISRGVREAIKVATKGNNTKEATSSNKEATATKVGAINKEEEATKIKRVTTNKQGMASKKEAVTALKAGVATKRTTSSTKSLRPWIRW